jgi:HEAT repeat protein
MRHLARRGCYSRAVAVATYPGTVSPIRGHEPFFESERDVFYGREGFRDELAAMVSAEGFRAGLLYGAAAVGKTSLLRAGLVPHLRDHGVVALVCDNVHQPAASFAATMSSFGLAMGANEDPLVYLTRAVTNAVAGQQFLFIIDDVDTLCLDERALTQTADLFARLVSRGAGRARFLMACRSESVHALGHLEKRTGSLFPPNARRELPRFASHEATPILERMLGLAGVSTDAALAAALVKYLERNGSVALDLMQLVALAARDLRIENLAALNKNGGARDLLAQWLTSVCKHSKDERVALRVLAEVVARSEQDRMATAESRDSKSVIPVDDIVTRVGADATVVRPIVEDFAQRGILSLDDQQRCGFTYVVLTSTVRTLTASTQESLRKNHEMLARHSETQKRLTLGQLRSLKTDGVTATTDAEKRVVARSMAHFRRIALIAIAVPLLVLITIYVAMMRRVYFATTTGAGGERIVVRSGRQGLSAFHWLPARPGFGSVVSDTGLTRSMVAPEQWKRISAGEVGAARGEWEDVYPTLLAPTLRGLWSYATDGSDAAIGQLRKDAKEPEDLAELLVALRPIARGTAGEVALVEAALSTPSPAVQRAGVAVAGAAAVRNSDVYQDTLRKALVSNDGELRRIAFSAVRELGGERAHALFSGALSRNPDGAARRELLIELSSVAASDDTPQPASIAAVLGDPDASVALRDRARTQMRGALNQAPKTAVPALIGLVAQERAPLDARLFAISALSDIEGLAASKELVDAVHAAVGSRSEAVKAAALPLYARIDPERAGADLITLLDQKDASALRIASALAWGELVVSKRGAAEGALEKLLKDNNAGVRAAAATAYGKLGRPAQDKLIKMVKNERYDVSIGAAVGLAASAEVGASVSVAVDGIAQLWRQQGRPRRDAAKIYAQLAKKKPLAVTAYLVAAARMPDDAGLHPIGVEGLCNAANAGSAEARRNLARSTEDNAAEVRRLVIGCVVEGPEPAKNGVAIATRLIRDADSEIRAEAARIIAMSAPKGSKVPVAIADALVQLIEDPDRDVRLIALRAISGLAADAPKGSAAAMIRLFERADEGEKIALVRAGRQIGAAELVAIAVADSSPVVRVEAVEASLASGVRVPETLSAAMADQDASVRRAALQRLAEQKSNVDVATLERALALAVRDADPELSQLALTTLARIAAKESVVARLSRSLASRTERERASAAAAAAGLVDRDAAATVQLLEPLLQDASHDVRGAMLPALAAAWAKTNSADQLAAMLRSSEPNAMRRLVVGAAFLVMAKTDAGRDAALAALSKIALDAGPMVKVTARLLVGLINSNADGLAFLRQWVP